MLQTDKIRRQLMRTGLHREDLDPDPFRQFANWYQQTLASDIAEPTAMALATVDENGQPWQRMVLLKLYDEQGYVFFTNYHSRKAAQIAVNPRVGLLFPWYPLGRQVKITGVAEKISRAESLRYFASRPRGSQIGAWSSHQSKVVKSRAMLDGVVQKMKQKFAHGEVPLPDFWGGYRVVPDSFEFWQAREDRLHDCFFYQRRAQQWCVSRLEP